MSKQKIHTITVGISAYNEAANIIYLLRSILKQSGNLFTIDEIIVINDGSTDTTADKVRKYAKKNPVIRLISDSKRKGQIVRLKQIFSGTKSDYIFIFDADVILSTSTVLNSLVRALNAARTGLVSADRKPFSARGIVAKSIQSWTSTLHQIRKGFNNGNTVYNATESAFGMRTDLARHVVFPKQIASVSRYLYFLITSHHQKFTFVREALVLYHTPQTVDEYIKQIRTHSFEQQKLAEIFGREIYKTYRVPISFQIKPLLLRIVKNPFTIIFMVFFNLLKLASWINGPFYKQPMWVVPSPAKRKAHSY